MKRIGVIRGGRGGYYNESLASGKNILDAISVSGHAKADILVDKNGDWHLNGFLISPMDLEREVDVIFNALHKSYHHSDNTLSVLERLNIPVTGSYKLAHSVSNNRSLSKTIAWQNGLSVPMALIVTKGEDLTLAVKDIFNTLSGKLILKPIGGSIGGDPEVVNGVATLMAKLEEMLNNHPEVIVEEFISGKEALVPVIENFRGKPYYTPFPVEIVRKNEREKYLSPGFFSDHQKSELARMAEKIHRAVDARHYSLSRFVIHPSGRIYFIKKESHPSLSPDSPLMQSLASVGCTPSQFVDHVTDLALSKN